jgi:hypothetical protein
MWLKDKEFSVKLGGNQFIDTPNLIQYRDTPLFTLYREEDGTLAIDFDIHDSKGARVATVRKNNVYGQNSAAYISEGTADSYTLKDKQSGALIVDIRRGLAAETELDISVITFLPDGRLLNLSPDGSNIAGNVFSGVAMKGLPVGIQID